MERRIGSPIKYLKEMRRYRVFEYSWGIFRPKVVKGYFTEGDKGSYQNLFFRELLNQGFGRTVWQLVFPGQTAGLVKKIPTPNNHHHHNSCHVRFYEDGTIDAELETGRFDMRHWQSPRKSGLPILRVILDQSTLTSSVREQILSLFGEKYWPPFARDE